MDVGSDPPVQRKYAYRRITPGTYAYTGRRILSALGFKTNDVTLDP